MEFFVGAGLPDGVAENYAASFVEHRIQTDMLIDLDKEYLREMGIQAMGDVIAILRHARKTSQGVASGNAARRPPLPNAAPLLTTSKSSFLMSCICCRLILLKLLSVRSCLCCFCPRRNTFRRGL